MPPKTILSKNVSLRVKVKPSDSGYEIERGGQIVLTASGDEITIIDTSGNDGEHGKIGASGRDGYRGNDGQHAYRDIWGEHSGTHGAQGGPGGAGEEGGHGQDGHDGGDVTIEYNGDEAAYLLDTVEIITKGGQGGLKGVHGQGGKGGEGGQGGRSYSYWIRVPYNHYPLINSHCAYHHISHYQIIESRPFNIHEYGDHNHHHHSHSRPIAFIWLERTIPGGLQGSRGPDGVTPRGELKNGRNGRDGRITYLNLNANQQYTQRYQFKFISMSIGTIDDRRLSEVKFEYGESLPISRIRLKNASDMPTPPGVVYLNSTSDLIQPDSTLDVASMRANSELLLNANINFRIAHTKIAAGHTQKTESLPLELHVLNPGLHRNYQGSSALYTLTVGYPIYLENLPTRMSVFSNGQLSITSIVSRDPTFRPIEGDKRSFQVRLQRNSKMSISGIDHTNWQETFCHEGHSVANETLFISLWWPKLGSGEWTEIQRQTILVQVTPTYQANHSGYLLVINGETPKTLVDAWYHRLQILAYGDTNRAIPIWNVSAYNRLDLQESLAENTKNGTIVILGNHVNHHHQYSSTMINESSLHAARKYHVRLVHAEVNEQNKSLEEMDKRDTLDLLVQTTTVHAIHELVGKIFQDSVDSRTLYSLSFKSSEQSTELKNKIQHILQHTFPNRRYAVVIDKSNICVQQMFMPCVARLENSDPIEQNLAQASPFVQKLQTIFNQNVTSYQKIYLAAILSDLKKERANLAKSYNFYSLYKSYYHDFTRNLVCLNQLLEQVKKMSLDELKAFSPILIHLVVEIQQEAKKHTSFWTWLVSFFVTQNDEKLKISTQCLSNEILQKMHEADPNATSKVALQLKLRHYLDQEYHHAFFRPGRSEDFAAARDILNACQSNDSSVLGAGARSKRLQSLYDEYESYYCITSQK